MDHAISWSLLSILLLLWNILDYTTCSETDYQTATIGSTVEFNCTVVVGRNESVTLKWDVDWWWQTTGGTVSTECGKPLRTNMTSSSGQYTSNYEITTVGTDVHHVCLLTVTRVTQHDAGKYGCSVVALSGNGSVSEKVNMTELSVVFCSSTPVNLAIPLTTITSAGIDFDFLCNVSGSHGSRTDIRWFGGDKTLISTAEGSEESSLQLRKTITPSDNGRVFYCEVTSSSSSSDGDDDEDDVDDDEDVALCNVTPLRVLPNACIDIEMDPVVQEGTKINMTCTSKGSSAFIRRYEWFIGDKMITPKNNRFTIHTTANFSESILTISDVLAQFNNTYFTCKAYTDMEGVEVVMSTNSTILYVQKNGETTLFGTDNDSKDRNGSWPIVIGGALGAAVFLIVAISLVAVKNKRPVRQNDDTERIANDSSHKGQEVNGYMKNSPESTGQINRTFNERRPSLDFLDVSSGRRRSSLFRESFQELWKGRGDHGDGDNISNCSSVSLPSFAAVSSMSTQALDSVDPNSDGLYSPSALSHNSHPPLSARASAPAAFHFNTKMNVKELYSSQEMQMEDIQDSTPEENDSISDIQDENGAQTRQKKESTASNASNMSIPSVLISSPPNSPKEVV